MNINNDNLKRYLREISLIPLLTKSEEKALAYQVKSGNKKAKDKMVSANLRLVVKIAGDFTGMGLPLPDLISEGNIGLVKAVNRFDPLKGSKLSTYASWWIKQGIKRAISNQGKTVRIPVHLIEKIGKANKVTKELSKEMGREPTDAELSTELGMSEAKVNKIKNSTVKLTHLDCEVSEYSTTTFADIIEDDNAENPFKVLEHKDLLAKLPELLSILDERERAIIYYRYALDGGKEKTLEQVGKKFNITRERIRQLQNLALKKMHRHLLKSEEVKYNDD
jgi:RNA polymerase primary sigma factor